MADIRKIGYGVRPLAHPSCDLTLSALRAIGLAADGGVGNLVRRDGVMATFQDTAENVMLVLCQTQRTCK
jgi:hypothetical protein